MNFARDSFIFACYYIKLFSLNCVRIFFTFIRKLNKKLSNKFHLRRSVTPFTYRFDIYLIYFLKVKVIAGDKKWINLFLDLNQWYF